MYICMYIYMYIYSYVYRIDIMKNIDDDVRGIYLVINSRIKF